MDDDKKKIAIIGSVIVIAVVALAIMISKGGVGGEAKGQASGTLEGGMNTKTGLPLDPPKNQGTVDPSLDR
ncbi:MAG: hypothetical protein K8R88_04260 [Armatimonadetes bacterium]|nr:hypothetical protein [Armatimonadota bacterium]